VELVSHKYLWVIIFMIFAPTVCHRHTITFCMPGRGYSVDGVTTCHRLDSRIWTPVGEIDFLFLLPVWTNLGAHWALFTKGNGPLSWEYSSQGWSWSPIPNLCWY